MGKIEITETETVNASADRLWEILSDDFLSVSTWASTVDSSEANPAAVPARAGAATGGRLCEVPGFGQTDERITRHDADNKSIAYSVAAKKIPGFVKGMENTWTVRATGDSRSTVSIRLSADATGVMGAVMGPMMKKKFASAAARTLADLKIYAETGRVSEAKTKATTKLAKR